MHFIDSIFLLIIIVLWIQLIVLWRNGLVLLHVNKFYMHFKIVFSIRGMITVRALKRLLSAMNCHVLSKIAFAIISCENLATHTTLETWAITLLDSFPHILQCTYTKHCLSFFHIFIIPLKLGRATCSKIRIFTSTFKHQ